MKKPLLLSCAMLAALATSASAQIIYSDTFDRGLVTPASLDASMPTVDTTGATWTADSSWTTNGTSANSNTGDAFLPLTITAGNIYTVSANLTCTSGDWVALGFAESDSHLGDWIQNGTNAGPWILVRSNSNGTQEFGGPDVSNSISTSGAGVEGDLYTITLDTISTDYVATFSEDGKVITTYTYTAATDPADLYVGFGVHNTSDASVSNFVVTATPEPSTWALMLAGLGAMGFLARRRFHSRNS